MSSHGNFRDIEGMFIQSSVIEANHNSNSQYKRSFRHILPVRSFRSLQVVYQHANTLHLPTAKLASLALGMCSLIKDTKSYISPGFFLSSQ